MTPAVLVDTGPLVAMLSRGDAHHQSCLGALRTLKPPLYTCWPVITEACWLLRAKPDAVRRLLGSFDGGLLRMLALEAEDIQPLAELLKRYRGLGPQLADVALVRLADREGIGTVFTLDHRDFSVYRYRGRRSFQLIP